MFRFFFKKTPLVRKPGRQPKKPKENRRKPDKKPNLSTWAWVWGALRSYPSPYAMRRGNVNRGKAPLCFFAHFRSPVSSPPAVRSPPSSSLDMAGLLLDQHTPFWVIALDGGLLRPTKFPRWTRPPGCPQGARRNTPSGALPVLVRRNCSAGPRHWS
jgi:hypothetical protein